MAQRGLWFDGRVATQRPVHVFAEPSGLALVDEAGERHWVDLAEIVRLNSPVGTLKLGHRSFEGWRLLLEEPLEPAIRASLPTRIGSLTRGVSRRTIGVLLSASTIVLVTIACVIFAPELIATRMPMSWERKLGAVYDLPIAAARCDDPRARAALETLVDRLDPQARSDGLTVDLVSFDMVNALALPGGRIVLLTGMLEEVDAPDAIAGILAHEIAHVRRRHVAAAVVRDLGVGTVVTLVGGGAVAANAGNLFSLRFSRTAEDEADRHAIAMLERARIDPRPTARLFEKFATSEAGGESFAAEFLSSHPVSSGRARNFAAAAKSGSSYKPVLGDADARALLTACTESQRRPDPSGPSESDLSEVRS